jgi:DNA polymerase-1
MMDQLSPGSASALAHFKVRPSYATDAAAATALVAEIIADAGDGLIAVDFETTPQRSERARCEDLKRRVAAAKGEAKACADRRAAARRGADGAAETTTALALAKAELAALQAAFDHSMRAGLDPHRSTVRLCQLYGGGARVAVIDLHKVDWDVLAPVWERPIVMHNAAFDLSYLAQRGIEPVGVDCTLQAVRLLNGPNATSLETAAASYFGLVLDKALQTSDWGAEHLSLAQVTYAADDAVVTWHLAETVLPLLGERRTAYDIQVGAIPAVVRMQLRGILLDATAHEALITALKAERARLTRVYAAACEEAGRQDLWAAGVPDNAPAVEALLTGLLGEQEREGWPRTPKSGKLSTRRVDLVAGAAAYPLLRALVDIGRIEKQLSTYGARLAAQISPVTGRIHAAYRVAGAISGRSTCSKPNMQNMPDTQPVEGLPSFRTLFVARQGHIFVAADWSSMEMRAAAHISGEVAMTAAFERGEDLHALTARTMLRLNDPDSWSSLPEDERKRHRKHAKPVNFGRLYGQGAAGLVDSAREQYGLILDLATAKEWIRAFETAYPDFTRWCRTFARACGRSGRIPVGREGGRTHEIHWNPDGYRYTQCLNLPIQGACADAFMLALTTIDATLFEAGIEGGPVAAPHDEIVLEVRCADAARAASLLQEAMTTAFAMTFPGAPLRNLVTVRVGRSWAEIK